MIRSDAYRPSDEPGESRIGEIRFVANAKITSRGIAATARCYAGLKPALAERTAGRSDSKES